MKPICNAPGCGRISHSRGLCGTHYQRLRTTGSVRAEVPIAVGAHHAWLIRNCSPNHDECVLWPFSTAKNGYGQVCVGSKGMGAHVVACEIAHGTKPSPTHEAAHSCGRRACINARHLRWATQVENAADRILHGTHLEGERANPAKLTNLQADQIRKDPRQQRAIAADYGVSQRAVSLIKRGETYRTNARMS